MSKAGRGVYAAAITPFDEDGHVNAEKLIGYCRHLITDGGCDGVAPLGTTGEGNSISLQDRLALPAAFAAAGFDSSHVIFGSGSCSSGDAGAVTRAAVAAGFCNVLVLPPFYYKDPSDDGLFAYFAQLIETVGDEGLRLYLYHFPQMSMTPISVDLVVRLRDAFGPVVAGLKDSSGDFSQSLAFVEATGGVASDFDVYPSNEVLLFRGLEAGCAGVISGSTNAFGRFIHAAKADGVDSEAFAQAEKARGIAANFPMVAAMKQMEAWRSGDPTWTRSAPPLMPLTEAQKADLEARVAGLA